MNASPSRYAAAALFPLAIALASASTAGAQAEPPRREQAPAAEAPKPIDFAKIPRVLKGEPTYVAAPRYALFLFGARGEKQLWIAFDKSSEQAPLHDVAYVDRDFDLVLGEEGERITGKAVGEGELQKVELALGDVKVPGEEAAHTGFTCTVRPGRAAYRMSWRGGQITMGGYGPDPQSYSKLGESPASATVFVPGWDRPFQFEHWMSGEMQRGHDNDFKVFVGNRGDRRGNFSCVDQKFLPAGEHVQATLIYRDRDGKEQRYLAKLRERC